MALGRLGSYEILERVGAGGMGVVFRAIDTRPERLGRVVALKVLSEALASDPESRARLLREARAEASLSHSNIATCYEVGEAALEPSDLMSPESAGPHPERVPFLAMEYVPGEDLRALVQRAPLPVVQVVDLGLQIAAGLDAAHRAGVLHRDLKPANVRLTPDGTAKIIDFGLARVRPAIVDSPDADTVPVTTTAQHLLGTVPYMSPEQAQHMPLDARSDLFSLGVVLYQLASGRLPFTGSGVGGTLAAIVRDEPPPLAREPGAGHEEFERIVRKLLAKPIEERYQSAHEAGTDLARLRARLQSPILPPEHYSHGLRWWLGAAAALAAVALMVLFARGFGPGLLEPAARNVVVLPFHDSAGDSTLDHVGAGLAADILGDLARHTELNVVSHSITGGLDHGDTAPRALARELGVGAVVSGAFRHEGGELHLEIELINARSGFVRWSNAYDWSMTDALRIKRDIVAQVARRLEGRTPIGAALDEPAPTHARGAYDAYLDGARLLDDADDPLGPDRASELFGRAIAVDPEFALAWAGRSGALFRLYLRDREPEALHSAELAADEAVRLSPGLPEARVARAAIYRATGRSRMAIEELQRVLRGNPNRDEVHLQLGATYRDAGQLAEAERSIRRAVALRPDYWRNWNALGALQLRRGDRAGARAAFERIVTLVPDKNRGYEQLAALDQLEGRYDDAIREYRRLPTPVNDATLASNIASAYLSTGRLAEARDYLALAIRLEPRAALWRENLGDLYVRLDLPAEAQAAYVEAVRLTEEALRVNPGQPDLEVERMLDLARAGDCAAAGRSLAALDPPKLAAAPEYQYAVAKVHALCGRPAPALGALRLALAHGIAAGRPRDDVEFRALRDDAAFRRLVGGDAASRTSTKGPP